MKTILYNPIFINPQAYYVFPRLTRYLQPDNESTSEPANYIGTIEVKVIAYGDTALKRTYTNTDSIDLSEFKNTWIRISLFTKVGSCVLGEWKIGNMESDLPYIDPEVLASLKAVVIVGNKTNNDSDRAIVKNLVDPDNPFVISNAAYTEGSGYADKGSPYYGAFVTDGIDDLITSTKTVQEMLGGSNEITVVSMIHQIGGNIKYTHGYTNYIRHGGGFIRNSVSGINGKGFNKTGIYGYTSTQLNSSNMGLGNVINNILGDKDDYSFERSSTYTLDDAKYSVQNFVNANNQPSNEGSSIAWYWTIIANKVLTTDEINQVIAYYDLDKYLEPTVLYNVKRQGLSNDTPASEWYLKDYSKNGYDMTLNNFSKAGGSGIAAKQGESIKDYSIIKDEEYQELTIYNEFKFKIKSKLSGRYWTVQYINRTNTSYPVTIVIDKDAYWVNSITYYDADNNKQVIRKDIPIAADTPIDVLCCGYDQFDIPEDATSIVSAVSYINYNAVGEITVELIPSCEGGLITDGVNDFGKVTGLPAYKDYTTIIDYQRFDIGYIEGKGTTGILSKAHAAGQGAFLMNLIGSTGTHMNSYSFGTANANTYTDLDRQIYYQTKYKMQGFDMTAGTGVDGDSMWLALVRDNDSRFFNGVFYSLLMFPYSMSEFLIERQLKKYELGTLHPGMVEFRPVVEPDERIKSISYYIDLVGATPGNYYPIGSGLGIAVELEAPYKVNQLKINGVPAIPNADHKGFNATLDSNTPQKITMDIVVDETLVQWNPIVQSNVVLNTADYNQPRDNVLKESIRTRRDN